MITNVIIRVAISDTIDWGNSGPISATAYGDLNTAGGADMRGYITPGQTFQSDSKMLPTTPIVLPNIPPGATSAQIAAIAQQFSQQIANLQKTMSYDPSYLQSKMQTFGEYAKQANLYNQKQQTPPPTQSYSMG